MPETTLKQRADAATDLDRIEDAFTRLLRRGGHSRTFERVMASVGAPFDRAGYGVLCRLVEGGPMRLSELASRTLIDASTASRQVQNLERAGLVARVPDPADRRATLLRVSDDGLRLLTEIRRARHDWLARLLESWSPEDRRTLGTLLLRLVNDIERSSGESA